jgi:phage baseplate assembly protein W
MAVIDLNNIVRPKKRNDLSTQLSNVVVNQKPVYTDLHLDLTGSKNVGIGLNVVNSGDILVDYDIEAIKNSLRNIFTTKRGQKILNPDFGSSLDQYLFTPITQANAKAIGNQILRSISLYEPRINIDNVIVTPDIDKNLYYIAIYYNLLEIKKNEIINIIAQLGGQVLI